MDCLHAIESRLEGHVHRRDDSRTIQPPHFENPEVVDVDDDFLFDDADLRNRRDKGAATQGFHADSGGGPHDFGLPDFNHFRAQGSGSRRGAFVGLQHRTFGRAPPRF